MITVDHDKCTHCGLCLRLHGGYCINDDGGNIVIDDAVCNACQKCIAICPQGAFSNNGRPPVRIDRPLELGPEDLMALMKRRRSVKHFKDAEIPRALLEQVAGAASRAPTMNKSIEVIVIDDAALIKLIDDDAMRFYMRLYRLLFSHKVILGFIKLFSETLDVIKRKMERDLIVRGRIVKDNTKALVYMIGRTKVPLTELSAQYGLDHMLLYAETAGLGSCLMDSLKIAANRSKAVRKALNIPKDFKILGVLALGYPDEKILNIPEGHEIKMGWNERRL